ncbi:polyprenol monophosphomannose synthase [Leucobacter sp. CSA2]|uniref:Polyprenol monophosphomannose synthase n=2 Tax=Leucobacter edaphi TaxID=2796472 RepID=A0A934QDD3_9MICO|nr:polyprenol monophosphomannose synthase [Leucobacter edaphi]MBK0422408.1 polyprenol monophosphomannose synthase [Leucobacter edaphi]
MPTYNEAETLETVLRGVRRAAPHADILVIDDGSPDGTGAIADRAASEDSQITVHHRAGKLGLGTAYRHGFQHALAHGYSTAVEMDSDGSHLPEQLPDLISAVASGSDLAVGTRWIPGGEIVNWPWYRRLISRTGTGVARVALRSRLRDLTSGYRALSADALRELDLDRLDSQGYGFQVETAWLLERAGLPIAEVPITFVERAGGSSKMSPGIVLEALRNVIRWGFEIRFGRLSGRGSRV